MICCKTWSSVCFNKLVLDMEERIEHTVNLMLGIVLQSAAPQDALYKLVLDLLHSLKGILNVDRHVR
ncbi:hypothetical protein Peur_061364 [Populus x canadensis]